jgi:hypothetical protein
MKMIKLKYTGKKANLHLALPHLHRQYQFNEDNGMTDAVKYEDAQILLKDNLALFKVVGKVLEIEDLPPREVPSLAIRINPDADPGPPEAADTNDGSEGEGPMPDILGKEEAAQNPVGLEPKTAKKGRK